MESPFGPADVCLHENANHVLLRGLSSPSFSPHVIQSGAGSPALANQRSTSIDGSSNNRQTRVSKPQLGGGSIKRKRKSVFISDMRELPIKAEDPLGIEELSRCAELEVRLLFIRSTERASFARMPQTNTLNHSARQAAGRRCERGSPEHSK